MVNDENSLDPRSKIEGVAPVVYFPIIRGRYTVTAGLRALNMDLGNSPADRLHFQLDREFSATRKQKLETRREELAKYFCERDLDVATCQITVEWMMVQLAREHPDYFRLSRKWEQLRLDCLLTQEQITVENGQLVGYRGREIDPPYASALDAVACQLQEDVAIVQCRDGKDYVAALHCCNANHWDAREKLGKNFVGVHAPVANFELLAKSADHLIDNMLNKSPLFRFAWGLSTNNRLNHHPEPAPGVSPDDWFGSSFEQVTKASELFMRIERQLIKGFPELGAFIFLVHTYYRNAAELTEQERADLRSAVETMHPDSLRYKNLAEGQAQILKALE